MMMLFGLIFRGLSFEFRKHARFKPLWDVAFGAGSLIAALSQGFILGSVIQGVPIKNGAFAGSVWGWLTPFSAAVAGGVVCGYALLGSTYLILKTEGAVQRRSYRQAEISAVFAMMSALLVTFWTPAIHAYVASKWFLWSSLYPMAPLPLLALFAYAMLFRALHRRFERAPFLWSLLFFLAAFWGLAVSLYPYLLPPALHLADAAASAKTLIFMLTGIGLLIPVMLIYNGYLYLVFRGKIRQARYGD